MRESLGGSMLLYILIPIVVLIILFVAFVMSYASAYRAANYLITEIETCNGMLNGDCDHSDQDAMEAFIRSKYHYTDDVIYTCTPNTRGAVWRVNLNVAMDFPLFGTIGIYRVTAETKTLYGVSCPT